MAGAGLPRTDLGSTALLVKLLRKVLLGCTLDELSERSGVDADLISRYEKGKVRKPTSRNLGRLLSAADVQDLEQPLLHAADRLSLLLSPPPADALSLEDLIQRTSQRLLQSESRLLPGEYSRPKRRDLATVALLTRFLRKILLDDCTLAELSARTGIHRDVLYRYETGLVEQPSRANLDRLLAEAQVLHLKEPLLRAMNDLSLLLSRQPQAANHPAVPPLTPRQTESFLAFAEDLLRRTSQRLGLQGENFPSPVPEE